MKNKRLKKLLQMATIGLVLGYAGIAQADEKQDTINSLTEHFDSVPTMSGEFVQFDPRGNQTGGKFYIQRPGKIRFNYDKPNPIRVISNGKTVAVNNRKLKTWDFYPLRKTPLSLLLGNKSAIDPANVRDVVLEPDLTTVVMGNDKVFGNSIITMMFDPRSYDLRQWVIKDAQGKETTVMIFNVEKNVELSPKLFKVDQLAIQRGTANVDR